MIRAVFFDLYGTLIDIRTDEYDSWVYETLSRYLGYHAVNIAPEEIKRAFFEGIQQHLNLSKEMYPEVDLYKIIFNIMNKYGKKRTAKGIVVDVAMLFRSLTMRKFRAFDGLYDTLSSLSAVYKTAIISDAQWVFAEPEIVMLGLDQFFPVSVLSSRFGFKKPDARLFGIAMEKLGIDAEESVYIGDNPRKDLPGAKGAGMKFILFGSECPGYEGLRPDRCFSRYSELEDVLRGML